MMMMKLKLFVGQCASLFFLALCFDVVGVLLLLVGLCASPQTSRGRFYGDFLIYTGSILVFISLGIWLMWYMGNITVGSDELEDDDDSGETGLVQLARKLTQRLSSVKVKRESITSAGEEEEEEEEEEEQDGEEGAGEGDQPVGYTNEAYEPTDCEQL